MSDTPGLVHLNRWSGNCVLAIETQREFVNIYDLHKGKIKQRFKSHKTGRFTAICDYEIPFKSKMPSLSGSFGFNTNNMSKKSKSI